MCVCVWCVVCVCIWCVYTYVYAVCVVCVYVWMCIWHLTVIPSTSSENRVQDSQAFTSEVQSLYLCTELSEMRCLEDICQPQVSGAPGVPLASELFPLVHSTALGASKEGPGLPRSQLCLAHLGTPEDAGVRGVDEYMGQPCPSSTSEPGFSVDACPPCVHLDPAGPRQPLHLDRSTPGTPGGLLRSTHWKRHRGLSGTLLGPLGAARPPHRPRWQ